MLQNGIYLNMEAKATDSRPLMISITAVRCLECGEEYAKPERGGTLHENPGCPRCGYLGWISASIPVTHRGHERLRSDVDRLPRRAARAR